MVPAETSISAGAGPHLDHERCIEVTVLKGKGADVQQLANNVISERHVLYVPNGDDDKQQTALPVDEACLDVPDYRCADHKTDWRHNGSLSNKLPLADSENLLGDLTLLEDLFSHYVMSTVLTRVYRDG